MKLHPPGQASCPAKEIDDVNEIDVASVLHHQPQQGETDPEHIQISDVCINAMTEAYATVQMPTQIGPNQQTTLRCKVDTSAGGNVMPLNAFSKLFQRCVTTDRTPTGLKPTRTHLTAYNGSTIKQYGTLDTAINWKPERKNVANQLHN